MSLLYLPILTLLHGLLLHLNPLCDQLTEPCVLVELHRWRAFVPFQHISTRFSRQLTKGPETVLGALQARSIATFIKARDLLYNQVERLELHFDFQIQIFEHT